MADNDPAGREAAFAIPAQLDDRILVQAAQAGDQAAFAALYDRYTPRVLRFGLLRTGSPHDAEDLVQQTFLHVVEALPRFEDRGLPFGAWVFRIARNTLTDLWRAHRHEASVAVDDVTVTSVTAADWTAAAIERTVVRLAIETLPSAQRDVIAYRYFADLSVRETGRLMERGDAAVRMLQVRALRRLGRELLGDRPRTRPVAAMAAP